MTDREYGYVDPLPGEDRPLRDDEDAPTFELSYTELFEARRRLREMAYLSDLRRETAERIN